MKAKKRNPNDGTMRNVRAANKRIDTLERRVSILGFLVEQIGLNGNHQYEHIKRVIAGQWDDEPKRGRK